MMLQNHARIGDKMFCGSEISSGQTFTNIFNLRCDLDLELGHPIFPQDTPACDAVLSNWVFANGLEV